jgi:hypothetical protein
MLVHSFTSFFSICTTHIHALFQCHKRQSDGLNKGNQRDDPSFPNDHIQQRFMDLDKRRKHLYDRLRLGCGERCALKVLASIARL